MGQFRAKMKDDGTSKIVAFKCRQQGCAGAQAQMRKLRPGLVQYVCTTCGGVFGVNQGGAVNL